MKKILKYVIGGGAILPLVFQPSLIWWYIGGAMLVVVGEIFALFGYYRFTNYGGKK